MLKSRRFIYEPTYFTSGDHFAKLFPIIKTTDKLVVVGGSPDSDSMIVYLRSGACIYHTDDKKLVRPFNAHITLDNGVRCDINITDLSNGKRATHCLPSVLGHDEPKSLGIQGLCSETHTMVTIRCDDENYDIFKQAMLMQTYGTIVKQHIIFPPVVKELARILKEPLKASTSKEMFRNNLKKSWSNIHDPLKDREIMSAYIYRILDSLIQDPSNKFATYSEQIDLMVNLRESQRASEKVSQIGCALFDEPEGCAEEEPCSLFNSPMTSSQDWEFNNDEAEPMGKLLAGIPLPEAKHLGSAKALPSGRRPRMQNRTSLLFNDIPNSALNKPGTRRKPATRSKPRAPRKYRIKKAPPQEPSSNEGD